MKEIKKYKEDVVIIDIGKNKGKGNALAEGIKKATGDILIFRCRFDQPHREAFATSSRTSFK